MDEDRQYVEYLVQLLQQLATGDASHHAEITQKLMHFNAMPKAPVYLASVFIDGSNPSEAVRGMSGIILKNYLKQAKRIPDALGPFIPKIVDQLNDRLAMVRSTAGSLLTTLISTSPDYCLEEVKVVDAVLRIASIGPLLDALDKITEDHAQLLVDMHELVCDNIIRFLLSNMSDQTAEEHLKKLISALNHLIPYNVALVRNNLPALLTALSSVGMRPSLQQSVCHSLNALISTYPDELAASLPSLLQYTFAVMEQGRANPNAALEATEFWLGLAEQQMLGSYLEHHGAWFASSLMPTLLRNMRFAEDAPELEEEDVDEDQDTDIRPRHHRAASHKEEGELDDSDEGVPDASDEDDFDYQWTLRKCSAATLDALSGCLDEANFFIPALLPPVQQLFNSPDWLEVEVAVLAVGAVAEGCRESMELHMASLSPILLHHARAHPKPLVRTISIWCLNRYAAWYTSEPGLQHLTSVLECILHGVISPSKSVQNASCSALIKFAEMGAVGLVMPAVLQAIRCALKTYRRKNLPVLYGTIETLANEAPEYLDLSLILPDMLEHWVRIKENDTALFPLLEALCALAMGRGEAFKPYAPPIVSKCLAMADRVLTIASTHEDDADYDVAIVAVDLLGGIVAGVQGDLLAMADGAALQRLVVRALAEQVTEVRQSIFALIGDMVSHGCVPLLEPIMPAIVEAVLANHREGEHTSMSTANNAVWAAGELALHCTPLVAAMLSPLFAGLVDILRAEGGLPRKSATHNYMENLAVCLGRLIGAMQRLTQDKHVVDVVNGLPLSFWFDLTLGLSDPVERDTCIVPVLLALRPEQLRDRQLQQLLVQVVDGLRSVSDGSDELGAALAHVHSYL